jgi:hypothetical protein
MERIVVGVDGSETARAAGARWPQSRARGLTSTGTGLMETMAVA